MSRITHDLADLFAPRLSEPPASFLPSRSLAQGLLAKLRRYPIPMSATLENCLVLNFALPAFVLRPLLPQPLRLEEFRDCGFVAIALVQARRMRPLGWPEWCGQDFSLVGYRVFCRYRHQSGRSLRGWRILRSETDKWPTKWLGNLLTHDRYVHARIQWAVADGDLKTHVTSADGLGNLEVHANVTGLGDIELPPCSPFENWPEARRFAGPMPCTFDCDDEGEVTIIRGAREGWAPQPARVLAAKAAFLQSGVLAAPAVLASAFYVPRVEYRWDRGQVENE